MHTRDELAAVAELAERNGVLVIADEVHAPMTLPGAAHVPYLEVGAENGLALVSASKAWNVPGLKCALTIAASERMTENLDRRLRNVFIVIGRTCLAQVLELPAFSCSSLDVCPRLDACQFAKPSLNAM